MMTAERQTTMPPRPRVVIIGGGFAGLGVARRLRRAPVDVTLVDRRNFHLFQPLLYQVATGGLSPANISATLRSVLKHQTNTRVMLGEACDVDLEARRVVLRDGWLEYDTLVVATGAAHHYFGHDEWARLAPGLKSIEDAMEMRRRILLAFELAEQARTPRAVRELLTFVVVGGGPTGVELAGAIAEIAHDTLRHEFRSINPAEARILLVDGHDCVLPSYPSDLSQKAQRQLEQLGVTVRTGATVREIQPQQVVLQSGDVVEQVATRTVLWAAGVRASPLGRRVAEAARLTADPMGRVPVQPDLTIAGYHGVFVIGDLACCLDSQGQPLPGVAPVAQQQARHVARTIRQRLRGRSTPAFRYRDIGTMATIGRNRAVAVCGPCHLSGYWAWLAWLLIHLLHLVEFRDRVFVMLEWAWNYVTWNRGARLITGAAPEIESGTAPASEDTHPAR